MVFTKDHTPPNLNSGISAGDVNNSTGAALYKNRVASQLDNSGTEKKSLSMGLHLSVFGLKPKAHRIKMALVMIAGFSPLNDATIFGR